jgi:hypothetical protein
MTCAFVPPYLLRHLAETAIGAPGGARGSRTLQLDERLRARRAAALPQSAGRQDTALAPADGTRTVHTAAGSEDLPGTVARDEGGPATGDAAVDEAYDSSGQVLDLFAAAFERRSVDGNGAPLSITVHYGQDYDNAFWDGTELVFGDGDGEIFDRFTKPMDVMAHEFTHGVTQFTAGLTYQGQSGALNESVSDVFASMAKQRALGQTADQGDWLIGEGLFLPGIQAKALRSMVEPGTAYDDPRLGKDPQVGSMADYVDTSDDSGGVHTNSGIPNRAFALAALAVGGSSWEAPGKVWYDALTSGEVTAATDFAGFATATVSSAGRLFPDDPTIADKVRDAWTTVGVLSATDADQPTDPAAPAAPDQPAPPEPSAPTVAVRRSGGFAGRTTGAELDLDADPEGPEIRQLLSRAFKEQITVSDAGADRFVYTVQYGSWELTVSEQDLTPELSRVVHIVLSRGN